MSTMLAQSFGRLLDDQTLTDFTISCRGVDFKVHRAFLIADSTFFKSVCTLPFKVSRSQRRSIMTIAEIQGFQEAKDSRVDLVDAEPELVAVMLRFLYTGEYDDAGVGRTTRVSADTMGTHRKNPDSVKEAGAEAASKVAPSMFLSTEVNTLLHTYGDKFGIPSLKAEATAKFKSALFKDYQSTHFEEAVRLMFEVTPKDSDIRFELINWCIAYGECLSDPSKELVKKHEPISWKIARGKGRWQ
jgi:BTB/POZ domain